MSAIVVGISDYAIAKSPSVLATFALGSCVGICLYNKQRTVGGLAHIMLPYSNQTANVNDNLKKFADTSIKLLISEFKKYGVNVSDIQAKIVGGAQMFNSSATFNIGERNVKAVKSELQKYNIELVSEETGDKIGRTIYFDIKEAKVEIKSAVRGNMYI